MHKAAVEWLRPSGFISSFDLTLSRPLSLRIPKFDASNLEVARCVQPRERMLRLLRGERADKLPFFHTDHHLLRGEKEREARNRGLGVVVYRPCYVESMPNVEVVTRSARNSLIRSYKTPVGSLTEVQAIGVGYGMAGYAFRDWRGVIPAISEFLVKNPEDYKVLKFIVENIHYEPYYYAVEDQVRHLGQDGIVVSDLPYEPMERLLLDWVDWRRFYIDLARNATAIDEIVEILERKYEKELFPLAADSPSEVIRYGGNVDSILVSPPMFRKYYLPSYSGFADVLHAKGKILSVHMDGRLSALAEEIAESRVDVVEAFTPPPMGDLLIDKALSLWKNKIIWINFPSAISTLPARSRREVKEYLIEQLRLVIPGERVALIVSTENRVSEENMMAMGDVMEKATLPLSRETIENIRASAVS
jgi:hypothetical protein